MSDTATNGQPTIQFCRTISGTLKLPFSVSDHSTNRLPVPLFRMVRVMDSRLKYSLNSCGKRVLIMRVELAQSSNGITAGASKLMAWIMWNALLISLPSCHLGLPKQLGRDSWRTKPDIVRNNNPLRADFKVAKSPWAWFTFYIYV